MSKWKLPFFSLDLIQLQIKINKTKSNNNTLTVSSKYFVTNCFSSTRVFIYTGRVFLPVWISRSAIILNLKFGEFISTKKITISKKKKKKKKK